MSLLLIAIRKISGPEPWSCCRASTPHLHEWTNRTNTSSTATILRAPLLHRQRYLALWVAPCQSTVSAPSFEPNTSSPESTRRPIRGFSGADQFSTSAENTGLSRRGTWRVRLTAQRSRHMPRFRLATRSDERKDQLEWDVRREWIADPASCVTSDLRVDVIWQIGLHMHVDFAGLVWGHRQHDYNGKTKRCLTLVTWVVFL